MNTSNSILIMTGLVVFAVFVLLFVNLIPFFSTTPPANFISLNDVRGSAVMHAQKPFTLNFEQQNQLVDYLNRTVTVKKSDYSQPDKNLGVQSITIYRFKAPDLEITPIAISDKNVVFSAPEKNPDFYFMDLSAGSLLKLLQSSFDPS